MKLYYSPGACSLSPHIVSREAGLKLDLEKVDLGTFKTEKGKDFKAVHPKAYVPLLELDDGSILSEGAVISQYLADKAPKSGLLPAAGTMERYRVQEWLNYISTELHKSLGSLFADPHPETAKSTKAALVDKFAYVVKSLENKKFLFGDTFTVADAYLFTVLSWAPYVKVELPKELVEYSKRVAARPAVDSVLGVEGLK